MARSFADLIKQRLQELRSESPLLTLRSLWGMWLVVTMCDLLTLVGAGYEHSWSYVPNAIFNLFTPILIANLWKGFSKMTLPLMFAVLFLGDLAGSRIHSTALRITYNLTVLLLLTSAIDYITWGALPSLARVLVILGFGRQARPY